MTIIALEEEAINLVATQCEEKLGGEKAVMIKKKISVLISNTRENISDVINGCDP